MLGLPKPKIYRGIAFVNATQATGWGGLAAARLAPALRNAAFLTLSEFLIVYGIIISLFELRRWTNRQSLWSIALYSVLDEIPHMNGEKEEKQQEEDIGGPAE